MPDNPVPQSEELKQAIDFMNKRGYEVVNESSLVTRPKRKRGGASIRARAQVPDVLSSTWGVFKDVALIHFVFAESRDEAYIMAYKEIIEMEKEKKNED